jgi:hypothetical protein
VVSWWLVADPSGTSDGAPMSRGAIAGGAMDPLVLQWMRPNAPGAPWHLALALWVVPAAFPDVAPTEVVGSVAVTVRYAALLF